MTALTPLSATPTSRDTYVAHDLFAITPSDSGDHKCRGLLVNCTVAGNIAVVPLGHADDTTVTIAVPVGLFQINCAMRRVASTGLTATATFIGMV